MTVSAKATSMLAAMVLVAMTEPSMAHPRCNMLKIAEKQIGRLFPRFDLKELKRVVAENGNLWELTYEMPGTSLGGIPIVTIDKRTCKVVRAIHT
ncbi:MAG: hypothetical protein HY244_17395 [Rhizobiales bacterium]|nr:hypothetical protein [Hyphomicrobiales bacterium]